MTKLYPIITLLIAVFSVGCSIPKEAITDDTCEQIMITKLDSIVTNTHVKGLAVAVVNNKGVVSLKAFGEMSVGKSYQTSSLQPVASISKVIVGLSLVKAQELGFLSLEDSVNSYLPFEVVNPNHPMVPILIKQLANNTSSVIDSEAYHESYTSDQVIADTVAHSELFSDPKDEESLETFLERTLTYSKNIPGEHVEYSNYGAALAALIIENATGQSFKEFSKQYVLSPLGMDASGWNKSSVGEGSQSDLYDVEGNVFPEYHLITYADGSLISSAEDLSKLLVELIKGYDSQGTVLSEEGYLAYYQDLLDSAVYVGNYGENHPYTNLQHDKGVFIEYTVTGEVGHTGQDYGTVSAMFFDTRSLTGRLLIMNTDIDFFKESHRDILWSLWGALKECQGCIQ